MRSIAREAAFQTVFARLLDGDISKADRMKSYKKLKLSEDDAAFAERLIATVQEHFEQLSATIAAAVTRFAEYRIYTADKAILLIALAEILYFDDIPPIVSVSEATALAKKFSTEKSVDFVNGVLGGIINP